jgi:hypothetical protein
MHEFLEYPEKDLTVPAPAQLNQYKNASSAEGPRLDPLVLDLASKGSSNWNKKAAKLFREAFLSLDISDCDDQDLIEATFLTHVDYLKKIYLKQRLDVAGKADATQRAKEKAKYARRKEVLLYIIDIHCLTSRYFSYENAALRLLYSHIRPFLK